MTFHLLQHPLISLQFAEILEIKDDGYKLRAYDSFYETELSFQGYSLQTCSFKEMFTLDYAQKEYDSVKEEIKAIDDQNVDKDPELSSKSTCKQAELHHLRLLRDHVNKLKAPPRF
jgi:hypothetical protein